MIAFQSSAQTTGKWEFISIYFISTVMFRFWFCFNFSIQLFVTRTILEHPNGCISQSLENDWDLVRINEKSNQSILNWNDWKMKAKFERRSLNSQNEKQFLLAINMHRDYLNTHIFKCCGSVAQSHEKV